MIRSFGKFVFTLGSLALLASPALAQNRGGHGGGPAGFLMAPNVQRDLKLTDNQAKRVEEALREIKERHQNDYAALRDASSDVRWSKMAVLTETVNDQVKTALSFSPEQSRRFDQISLQAQGLMAFASRAVEEKLKLSDDQKSKVREIADASHNASAAIDSNQASEQERNEARDKRAQAHKENMTRAYALLTDDQKTSWKELIGEPIHIDSFERRSTN
jgi:PAS domain-containing protein